MNIPNAFLSNTIPENGIPSTSASQPGDPCRCRLGVKVSQTLINARLTATLRRLDDIDASTASGQLPDWTGEAAEEYRDRLNRIAKQSALLRDGILATSRLLWSEGAA